MLITWLRDNHMTELHDIHALLHRNCVTMYNNQHVTRAVFLLSNAHWLLYKPRIATLKYLNFANKMYL